MTVRLRMIALSAVAVVVTGLVTPSAYASAPVSTSSAGLSAPSASASSTGGAPLTNLAHLNFLTTSVRPPKQARHTTYHLAGQPTVGVLWVYAQPDGSGGFTRLGGGDYDAATNTYSQGAYDADDIARAAVVYLRHFRQFGDVFSRRQAVALLRGLTYLQTASGPDAGNVVLWMQPDGTLTPSAKPVEQPDPSDSANSYWLARTLWALGEGYADLVHVDRAFAMFLRSRLLLGVRALERDSLSRYGRYLVVDGARTPAWLIANGADASAEAVLGLSAFVSPEPRSVAVRSALTKLADGIAALGSHSSASRSGSSWPYGAILPSATTRSSWHSWASLTPAGLSAASMALDRPALAQPAVSDAAAFSPDLLTSYGPINGLTPAPTDRSSIAYGADSRVESLLAVARLTGSSGLRTLAGEFAGWFFGQNPAGTPMYDRATGVTYDGVSADGVVNPSSGAESTIHGLLTMLALDSAPDVARIALAADSVVARTGTTVIEGEAATTSGAASAAVATPASSAESAWSGGAYLQVTGTATAQWTVPASDQPRIVEAVINRVAERAGVARFSSSGRRIGRAGFGGGGAQGASAVAGRLVPVVVGTLPAHATTLRAVFRGGAGQLDAVLLTPLVSSLQAGSTAVLSSRSSTRRSALVSLAGPILIGVYDRTGTPVGRRLRTTGPARVRIPAGGFATAAMRRGPNR